MSKAGASYTDDSWSDHHIVTHHSITTIRHDLFLCWFRYTSLMLTMCLHPLALQWSSTSLLLLAVSSSILSAHFSPLSISVQLNTFPLIPRPNTLALANKIVWSLFWISFAIYDQLYHDSINIETLPDFIVFCQIVCFEFNRIFGSSHQWHEELCHIFQSFTCVLVFHVLHSVQTNCQQGK